MHTAINTALPIIIIIISCLGRFAVLCGPLGIHTYIINAKHAEQRGKGGWRGRGYISDPLSVGSVSRFVGRRCRAIPERLKSNLWPFGKRKSNDATHIYIFMIAQARLGMRMCYPQEIFVFYDVTKICPRKGIAAMEKRWCGATAFALIKFNKSR